MAERVFNCPDCGVEVKTKYSRTLRCKECARKHDLECKRQWHKENGALLNTEEAVKKRESARAEDDSLHFCDPPENIKKCLTCERKKCNNCLSMYARSKEEKENA